MMLLEPGQVLALFASFHCTDLAVIYAARDRAAALASKAFDEDGCRQLSDLQALLRAATAIAVVNGHPSAVFVESGSLWRAKLNANRRLLQAYHQGGERSPAESDAPVTDPFRDLTFDLFTYSVFDFETALLTAAALPPFRAHAMQHFAASLAAAGDLDHPELREWQARTSLASLQARFAKSRLGGAVSQLVASTPLARLEPGRAADRDENPPRVRSSAGVESDLLGLADAVREQIGYYKYPRKAPFHQLVGSDPITRNCFWEANDEAILVLKPVVDAMAGRPPPDPHDAPVAAIVYAAFSEEPVSSGGP